MSTDSNPPSPAAPIDWTAANAYIASIPDVERAGIFYEIITGNIPDSASALVIFASITGWPVERVHKAFDDLEKEVKKQMAEAEAEAKAREQAPSDGTTPAVAN